MTAKIDQHEARRLGDQFESNLKRALRRYLQNPSPETHQRWRDELSLQEIEPRPLKRDQHRSPTRRAAGEIVRPSKGRTGRGKPVDFATAGSEER